MTRTPEFLRAMDELGAATDQSHAMLTMLMVHFTEAESGGELLNERNLLNYVWALKDQNERQERAIKAISQATAPAAA